MILDRVLFAVVVVVVLSSAACKKNTPPPVATPAPAATPRGGVELSDDEPMDDDAAADDDTASEAAPAAAAAAQPAASRAVTADVLALGTTGFEQGMCAKCHGANGEGSDRAPNLTDDDWLHCDGTIAGIRAVLVSGVSKEQLKDPSRPHAMNPATKLIPDDQMINALAVYIWHLGQE